MPLVTSYCTNVAIIYPSVGKHFHEIKDFSWELFWWVHLGKHIHISWNNFEILSISGPNYTQDSNSKIYSHKKIIVISYKVICLQNAKCKFITLFSKHSLTMNTTCTRHQLLLFDYRSSLTTVILKVHSKYFYQD